MYLAGASVGRVSPDYQRALAAVNLELLATRMVGHGGGEKRDLGATFQAAGDADPVRRIDLHSLARVGVVPLRDACRQTSCNRLEIAQNETQRINRVPAGDGQRVRAILAV